MTAVVGLLTPADRISVDTAAGFFYEHAGWSHGPDEDPERGRWRCARELAWAEFDAGRLGMEFQWETDMDAPEFDEPYRTVEVCLAYWAGEVVASLGAITDATDEYRRVVEAELAAEVLA